MSGDEGVSVKPLAAGASGLVEGIWLVEHTGAPLLRFDGKGAEDRARAYAAGVRKEIQAGTFGAQPKGRCSLGHPCDRDRLATAFLRDVSDAVLARVKLCPEHQEAARPGTGKPSAAPPPAGAPSGGSPGQGPAMGRRRKQPSPPAGGVSLSRPALTAAGIRQAFETTAGGEVRAVAWALGVSADELLLAMARLGVDSPQRAP